MFSKLISKLRTVTEANEVDRELDLLLTGLYESGEKGFESVLKTKVRAWVAEQLMTEVGDGSWESYLKGIRESISTLEHVNLSLAFEPSETFLDELSAFMRESLGGDAVLLEIVTDKTIMGGVVVSVRGKYKDLSLVKLFDRSIPEIDDIISEKLGTKEAVS